MNLKPIAIKRALISVTNKDGITAFAQSLHNLEVEILSTGGTATALRQAGLPVIDVSDYTGFPEIMDGRIKSIHPLVEGGILGLRDQHADEAEQQGIQWIDLVVCNLYPFAETIQQSAVTLDTALENIDIGGPTLIRSAAKNPGWVGVVVDPADYAPLIEELQDYGGLRFETRRRLAAVAFGHTAQYDTLIHNYLKEERFSRDFSLSFVKYYDLRYGENPHQGAAAYRQPLDISPNILNARIRQGKQLSYNNFMDADAALACVQEYLEPACVVVKHANPCGVAVDEDITAAYQQAFAADSRSAFGGIIALNRPCTVAIAEAISGVFMEIILAPAFDPEALERLAGKKNLRVLEIGPFVGREPALEYRHVAGGLLVQETDTRNIKPEHLNTVTEAQPTPAQLKDLLFAWKVVKHVKSNAILIARNQATLGIGAGQVSRVDAVELALKKGGSGLEGAVLASDAFFPFRDSIDKLAGTGIQALIQPGGSRRDGEVIQACNQHGIAMVFTGARCFKH